MGAERWAQIERLYHAALARPVAERAAFLAEACAGDEELRSEVAGLLDTPPTVDGVLARPAAALAAPAADSCRWTTRRLERSNSSASRRSCYANGLRAISWCMRQCATTVPRELSA